MQTDFPPSTTPADLQVRDLAISYREGKPVLDNINLDFKTGSYTLIAGPTGSGKSTLALCLAGVLGEGFPAFIKGNIKMGDVNLRTLPQARMSHIVAAVWQRPDAQMCGRTVLEEVRLGLDYQEVSPQEGDSRALAALKDVGLDHIDTQRDPMTLSGGEQQRLALAAALVLQTPILILDEATSQLDSQAEKRFVQVLSSARQRREITVIAIDHRPDAHIDLADTMIVLNHNGSVEFADKPEKIFTTHWSKCEKLGLRIPQTFSKYAANAGGVSATDDGASAEPAASTITGFSNSSTEKTTSTSSTGWATSAASVPSPSRSSIVTATTEINEQASPSNTTSQDIPGFATHADATSTIPVFLPTPTPSSTIALSTENLSVYALKEQLLHRINFTIPPGAVVAVQGLNGAGKTTLLRILAAEKLRMRGSIDPNHKQRIKAGIGYCPQRAGDLFMKKTIAEEIRHAGKYSPEEYRQTLFNDKVIRELLEEAALPVAPDEHPLRLSGGQRQRLAVLTSTIASPSFLILDEPTSSQDLLGTEVIVDLIRKKSPECTALIATHDDVLVTQVATHRIVLKNRTLDVFEQVKRGNDAN